MAREWTNSVAFVAKWTLSWTGCDHIEWAKVTTTVAVASVHFFCGSTTWSTWPKPLRRPSGAALETVHPRSASLLYLRATQSQCKHPRGADKTGDFLKYKSFKSHPSHAGHHGVYVRFGTVP